MADKSSNIKERILQIAEYKGITKETFFKDLGLTYGNFKGKSKETPINSNALADVWTKYPDINPAWLLTGNGEMLILDELEQMKRETAMMLTPPRDVNWTEGQKAIQAAKKNEIINSRDAWITEKRNEIIAKSTENKDETTGQSLDVVNYEFETEFRKLGEERYLIISPLVRSQTVSAYIANYNEKYFLHTLPRHATSTDSLSFGIYRSFEISEVSAGLSIETSLKEGWIVTGKRIERANWQYGFQYRSFPIFAVVTSKGIYVRQLSRQSIQQDEIILSGPEISDFPENKIKISDILEMYNVVSYVAS